MPSPRPPGRDATPPMPMHLCVVVHTRVHLCVPGSPPVHTRRAPARDALAAHDTLAGGEGAGVMGASGGGGGGGREGEDQGGRGEGGKWVEAQGVGERERRGKRGRRQRDTPRVGAEGGGGGCSRGRCRGGLWGERVRWGRWGRRRGKKVQGGGAPRGDGAWALGLSRQHSRTDAIAPPSPPPQPPLRPLPLRAPFPRATTATTDVGGEAGVRGVAANADSEVGARAGAMMRVHVPPMQATGLGLTVTEYAHP